MSTKRTVGTVAVAGAALLGLTACGGGGGATQAECNTVKKDFQSISGTMSGGGPKDIAASIRSSADKLDADVKDSESDKLTSGVHKLTKQLRQSAKAAETGDASQIGNIGQTVQSATKDLTAACGGG